ncbi:uncharacterized protein LOC113496698 [Trichoplusia ni]|uniref:Uncharacterized protein LOC113496698 n=1 Tax=Trichoplusia ni TaxID=7111 RepID=A0A7E5VU15_TRINI|nr:uncharacterized protein LOC113496698 [Trichoplusia ni]
MTSIFKNIRSGIHPQVKSNYSVIIFHSNSFYRCFSKKCGKKCSDDDDKPPPIKCLSPSSGDTSNPNTPNMYDSRKFGHNLSTDTIVPCFETLPDIPTGVFRCTTGEVLGRGAGKCAYYQNPEYFSFHHMSFYDFNLAMRSMRRPCAKLGRKPV